MRHANSLADRLAGLASKILAAANLLFLLTFIAVLLFAVGRVRAEEVRCTGANLVEELPQTDPALLASIEREAATTPNGKGLLWRVETGQGRDSFLFGTMHLSDHRILDLPESVRAAFGEARAVVIETTDILDKGAMMAVMAARPELFIFPAGEALTDHLTPGQQDVVDAALKARGVPLASVVKMKPWMLASMIALPACELGRQQAGALVLDARLAADAKAAGKRVLGLETAEEQLSAMASLPLDMHMQGLVSTLALGKRLDDMIETMTGLYLAGDTGMFIPSLKALTPDGEDAAAGYAAFEEALIVARNKVMADRAAPLIEAGSAFIAVGAMHLPGEAGLIELLRERGYRIVPQG